MFFFFFFFFFFLFFLVSLFILIFFIYFDFPKKVTFDIKKCPSFLVSFILRNGPPHQKFIFFWRLCTFQKKNWFFSDLLLRGQQNIYFYILGEAYNQNDYATVISISSATPSPIAHLVVNAGHGMWVKKCSLSSCFLVSDLEERPVWMGGRVFPSSVVWVEMEGGGEKRRGVALGGRGEESVDILFQDGEVEEISLSRISVGGEKEKKFVEVGDSVRRVRNWKRVLESLRGGVDEEEEKKFSCWEDGVVVGVVEK